MPHLCTPVMPHPGSMAWTGPDDWQLAAGLARVAGDLRPSAALFLAPFAPSAMVHDWLLAHPTAAPTTVVPHDWTRGAAVKL